MSATLLRYPFDGAAAWTAATIRESDWRVPVSAACREEMLGFAHFIRRHPLPVLLRRPEHWVMPLTLALVEQVRMLLDRGVGHAVIDRLPIEEMDELEVTALYWVLTSMLGRPVPQKWDGTMIYPVTDTGAAYDYGVRASVTNIGITFHSDNIFSALVPQYVGLLCLRPALSGGESRLLSYHSLYNTLLREYPEHLPRLYRPFPFDRQGEHDPDAPRISHYPVFAYDGQLQVRSYPTLIRRGYLFGGESIDPQSEAALVALQEASAQPELWCEYRLERGQVQFVNNPLLGHARTVFQDNPAPQRKRLLIRLWVRDEGPVFFDPVGEQSPLLRNLTG